MEFLSSRFIMLMLVGYSSATEWNIIFSILRATVTHQEAATASFKLISEYVSDGPGQMVTVDNFPGLVVVLDEYSSAANNITDAHRRGGRRAQQLSSSRCVLSNLDEGHV